MSTDPTPDNPFRLGTRRSPLAVAQACETRERLCTAHGWAENAVELVTVVASGDKIQHDGVGDEFAALHHRLRLQAHRRRGSHSGP